MTKPQKTKGKADDTDLFVGQRIRTVREALNISQETLAQRVGVSFQQLQKYENGTNRIAAGRLYQVAEALGVEPGSFFPSAAGSFELAVTQAGEITRLKGALANAGKGLLEAAR